MRALLLAHSCGEKLAPLTDTTPLALLPVANKPLLQHALESLAFAGIRDVTITVPPCDTTIERYVAGGRRWGLSVRFVESGTELEIAADTLVLTSDAVRSPRIVAEVADGARRVEAPVVRATIGADEATVWFLRAGQRLTVGGVEKAVRETDVAIPVCAGELRQYRVHDFVSFHAANLAAAAGEIPGIFVDGRSAGGSRRVGSRARIAAASLVGRRALVGARAWVERSARIGDGAVVGEDVVIDARASVQTSVILPNTYVGRSVAVSDSIVCGKVLIRVDTGVITEIADPFLLDALRPSRGTGRRLLSWFRSAA